MGGEFAVETDFGCLPCPAQIWCANGEWLVAAHQHWFRKHSIGGVNTVVAIAARRGMGHRDVTS